MPWTYRQATGELLDPAGEVIAHGYSGCGLGKNNAAAENQRGVGPIPRGIWTIHAPRDDHHMGPFVLALEPDIGVETFGRDGFYLHGDALDAPGTASHGCVIVPRKAREAVWESGDHRLDVVRGDTPAESEQCNG